MSGKADKGENMNAGLSAENSVGKRDCFARSDSAARKLAEQESANRDFESRDFDGHGFVERVLIENGLELPVPVESNSTVKSETVKSETVKSEAAEPEATESQTAEQAAQSGTESGSAAGAAARPDSVSGASGRAPRLRVHGFTQPWQTRKLEDFGSSYGGLSGKNKDDFGHGDASFVTYKNVFLNPVADLDNVGSVEIDLSQNEVRYGDVFFTVSSEIPEEVGMSSVWVGKSENVYLNSFCFGYRPDDESVDPFFMAYMLRSDEVRRKLIFLAQGISRYNISKKAVLKIEVKLPSMEEQRLVGRFFSGLDRIIRVQERKTEALRLSKKYFLQNMFPRRGESAPRLRVHGFTQPWQTRKLEDFGSSYGGLSGKNKDDFGHGDASFVTYKNVFLNPVADLDNVGSVEIDLSQNEVRYGDVFFTVSSEIPEEVGMSSVWVGKSENVYLNSFCFGYRPDDESVDPFFMAYMLRSDEVRRKLIFLAQGISRYNISKKAVLKIEVKLPSMEEQRLVGRFFSGLDRIISVQERKTEALRQAKKYYLQNMFA